MKKVVLFYVELSHYRLPILERVARHCDLTVVYGKGKAPIQDISFKTFQVPVRKLGPFYIFRIKSFFDFLKDFDVVIGLMDLRLIQFMLLCFLKRPYKLALWGIGVSGSYTKKFNVDDFSTKVRTLVASHADSLIFYSAAPINKFLAKNFDIHRMYIAHNTIDNIVPMSQSGTRDSVIFVGTLYRAKGLESLIDSYRKAYEKNKFDIPKLTIIGGGELLEELKAYVSELGLEENINLTGPIYDGALLKTFFDRAIFTVSPKQAGLSVLTSMSYGVPFVTCKDAITGGEILNIEHGVNGYLLDSVDALTELFLKAGAQPEIFYEMGRNAFNFYRDSRHPDIMANAVIKCIKEI